LDNTISVEDSSYRYYLNNNVDNNSVEKNLLIECSINDCNTVSVIKGFYLNSGNNLIYCDGNDNCDSPTLGSEGKYYKNNGRDKYNHVLIYCSNNSCYTKEATSKDGYYIHGGSTNLTEALIHCTNSTYCENLEDGSNGKYYINQGDDRKSKLLIYCSNNNCFTTEASLIDGYYIHGGSTNLTKSLIHCTNSTFCENPKDGINEKYYVNQGEDNERKPLIYCSRNNCFTTEADSTGYYITIGNIIMVCIIDQGCVRATDSDYITDSCEDEHLGLIVKQSGGEYLYLCSSVEIDKSKSGIYITSVNINTFPDTTKGLTIIEYDHIKNTYLKVDVNDQCTKDRQIMVKNNLYYYCTNVIIHEVYENDGVTLIDELTSYESIPVSINSVGGIFVLNFGNEYKVLKVEENGKITMDYGKYLKKKRKYN